MYVHISMLITTMLVHGHSPSMLTRSMIIPIIKGSNVNKNDCKLPCYFFEFYPM